MRSIYLLDGGEDEHPDDDSEVEISLHAMSSASTKDTMRLPVSVQDQGFNTLVDSSFTHCFMAANVAKVFKSVSRVESTRYRLCD
jgi:hypothetical protein